MCEAAGLGLLSKHTLFPCLCLASEQSFMTTVSITDHWPLSFLHKDRGCVIISSRTNSWSVHLNRMWAFVLWSPAAQVCLCLRGVLLLNVNEWTNTGGLFTGSCKISWCKPACSVKTELCCYVRSLSSGPMVTKSELTYLYLCRSPALTHHTLVTSESRKWKHQKSRS